MCVSVCVCVFMYSRLLFRRPRNKTQCNGIHNITYIHNLYPIIVPYALKQDPGCYYQLIEIPSSGLWHHPKYDT